MEAYQEQLRLIREKRKADYEKHKEETDKKKKEDEAERKRKEWLPLMAQKYGVRGMATTKIQRAVRAQILPEVVNMNPQEMEMVPGVYRMRLKMTEDNLVQSEKPINQANDNNGEDNDLFDAYGIEDIEDVDIIRQSMMEYQGEDGVDMDEIEMMEHRAIMESMGIKWEDDSVPQVPVYDPEPEQTGVPNMEDLPENPFQNLSGDTKTQIQQFFQNFMQGYVGRASSSHPVYPAQPNYGYQGDRKQVSRVTTVSKKPIHRAKTDLQKAIDESRQEDEKQESHTLEDQILKQVIAESTGNSTNQPAIFVKPDVSVDEEILEQILAESAKEASVGSVSADVDLDDQILAQMMDESMIDFPEEKLEEVERVEDEIVQQIIEKSMKEDKPGVHVCIDLRVYGPDPYLPIYVGDTPYYLNPEQIEKVKMKWNQVNPETEAGEQFHQKMEYVKNMAKDMKQLENPEQ